jgi:hypothetical protein
VAQGLAARVTVAHWQRGAGGWRACVVGVVAPFHPLQVSAAVGGMALPPGQQANAAAVPVVALQQFLAALRARDFEGAKRLAFQSESLHLEPCPCCDARVARRVSERGGAFVAQSSPTSRTIGPC